MRPRRPWAARADYTHRSQAVLYTTLRGEGERTNILVKEPPTEDIKMTGVYSGIEVSESNPLKTDIDALLENDRHVMDKYVRRNCGGTAFITRIAEEVVEEIWVYEQFFVYRIIGELRGGIKNADIEKVDKWSRDDFSAFKEGEEKLDVPLKISTFGCWRCTGLDSSVGGCTETILLRLWRTDSWKKIRRINLVLGKQKNRSEGL